MSLAANALADLVAHVPREIAKAFRIQLTDRCMRYYHETAIVLVSWNSLSTPIPDVVIRPATSSGRAITFRLKRERKGATLDVIVQVHAPKVDVDRYLETVLPTSSRSLASTSELVGPCAAAWLSRQELRERPLPALVSGGASPRVDEDLLIVATLGEELVQSRHLGVSNAVKAMLMVLLDERARPQLDAELADLKMTSRIEDVVASLGTTEDASLVESRVDAGEKVCVYSDHSPLRVVELPGGCGFLDLLPRRFIIEPIVVLLADTLERPLSALTTAEEAVMAETAPGSTARTKNRIYYILRKNSREQMPRERLRDCLTGSWYATRLVLFDSREEAMVALGKLSLRRTRDIPPGTRAGPPGAASGVHVLAFTDY
jgi:hypothetical protein